MSPYYLEATVLSLIFVIIQYRNFHQHHHCHHQSIYRHNHHHYVLIIIIVCNRNIRRATVLSLIFIPEEGIRSPCLSALKMFTHEHHTVPYFFLQCSQGQNIFTVAFIFCREHTPPQCVLAIFTEVQHFHAVVTDTLWILHPSCVSLKCAQD